MGQSIKDNEIEKSQAIDKQMISYSENKEFTIKMKEMQQK